MVHASLRPDHITQKTLRTCVNKYPSILTRVYAVKNAKVTAKEGLEDDEWRYELLPKLLKDGDGMTKEQLARLVKWKITHGTFRPFLPGVIQKNTKEEVLTHTSRAAEILKPAITTLAKVPPNKDGGVEAYKTIEAALKEVTYLKGVGPATGTLVLSVYTPEHVPFFADELFHWVVPEYGPKLKYDKKEYGLLWKGVRGLVERIGDLRMSDIEKGAYVLMHFDQLENDEKEEIMGLVVPDNSEVGQKGSKAEKQVGARDENEEETTTEPKTEISKGTNTRVTKRKPIKDDPDLKSQLPRRSKRVKD